RATEPRVRWPLRNERAARHNVRTTTTGAHVDRVAPGHGASAELLGTCAELRHALSRFSTRSRPESIATAGTALAGAPACRTPSKRGRNNERSHSDAKLSVAS